MELRSGTAKAIIEAQGAYITNLSDEKGDILFPRRMLTAPDGSSKVRGGCHVCLPNFGPGGKSGLAQHGFGRTELWKVESADEKSVTLVLENGAGEYQDMRSVVMYQLKDTTLTMTLELFNNGKRPLPVAPAFHPYFATSGEEIVEVNGGNQPLDELAEAQFITGERHDIRLRNRHLILTSVDLPVLAEWTDQLGKYVCFEPTKSGFAFLNDTAKADELVAPGGTRTYSTSISWD